jgi:uncharacterized membrane protein YbhN (UPF0104 family)
LAKEIVVNKRILINLFKYGLGFAVLAFVIWRKWEPSADGGPGLKDALANPIQPLPLIVTAVLYLVGALLTFIRWYVLVRAQKLPFTLPDALRLGLIGFFFSSFLPGSIGGDLVKATFLAREQSRRTVAVATVLLDRAMGLWGILWMVTLLGVPFWLFGSPLILGDKYLRSIILAATGVIGVTLILCLVLNVLPPWRAERFARRLGRIPKLGHMASEFWRAIWMYRLERSSIAGALLLSLASQVCFVVAFFYAAQVFQNPEEPVSIPTLREHFLLVPVGTAVQALFPSPGGVGGGEAMFGWLYARVDERMGATGVLASLAQRIIVAVLGFLGYMVYLRMRRSLPAEPVEEPELVTCAAPS